MLPVICFWRFGLLLLGCSSAIKPDQPLDVLGQICHADGDCAGTADGANRKTHDMLDACEGMFNEGLSFRSFGIDFSGLLIQGLSFRLARMNADAQSKPFQHFAVRL